MKTKVRTIVKILIIIFIIVNILILLKNNYLKPKYIDSIRDYDKNYYAII